MAGTKGQAGLSDKSVATPNLCAGTGVLRKSGGDRLDINGG